MSSTLSSGGIVGDCTVHIHHRLRGGSREDVTGQWTCSQCFAPRCWPVLKSCCPCGAAREDLPVSSKGKGNGKGDIAVGPLGRKPPPTQGMCRPRHVNHKSCLLDVRLGAGVGSPPTPETPPLPPLKIGQGTSAPEDFSKYEKKSKIVLSSVNESFLRLLRGSQL